MPSQHYMVFKSTEMLCCSQYATFITSDLLFCGRSGAHTTRAIAMRLTNNMIFHLGREIPAGFIPKSHFLTKLNTRAIMSICTVFAKTSQMWRKDWLGRHKQREYLSVLKRRTGGIVKRNLAIFILYIMFLFLLFLTSIWV